MHACLRVQSFLERPDCVTMNKAEEKKDNNKSNTKEGENIRIAKRAKLESDAVVA